MRLAPFVAALGLLTSGPASGPALAATLTSSFSVTATISSACQASTPVAAFRGYPSTTGSSASVTCTSPTSYNVTLTAGSLADADPEMADSGKILSNNALLSRSAHTLNHGRIVYSGAITGTGRGLSQAQTFDSQTAQVRQVSSGAFADAITVTIAY
jgi:spore coat protein U-like protein